MTCSVCFRADNRDDVIAAVLTRRSSDLGPGSAELDALIGVAASNHRGRRVDYSHLLTAGSAVATNVSSLPAQGRIQGTDAMTIRVGASADNRDGVTAAVIGRSRQIKTPG